MLLMVLAALWTFVFGSITITDSLRLEGRRARLYGATLLAVAVLLFLLGPVLESMTPALLLTNDAARVAVNAVISAVIIVVLVLPFREKPGGPHA